MVVEIDQDKEHVAEVVFQGGFRFHQRLEGSGDVVFRGLQETFAERGKI